MQKRYGVIDIGSNTVVLLIYAVDGPNIQKENYLVTAAHLVQYVSCGHMSLDGIHRAAAIVEQYKKECEKAGVSEIHADITACGRGIDNGRQLVNAIANTGITSVRILSGEEEAACDFYGTSFDRRISEGLLIDVGGGSTEFVAFRDNQIIDQASIPLGCVRLRRMPYYIDGITPVLKELKEEHPLLVSHGNGLGVGGTVRACQAMCRTLYYDERSFRAKELHEIYDGLVDDNPAYIHAMRQSVSADRQDVFIPGLRMLKCISDMFDIQCFYNSQNGVREGFLLKYILHAV